MLIACLQKELLLQWRTRVQLMSVFVFGAESEQRAASGEGVTQHSALRTQDSTHADRVSPKGVSPPVAHARAAHVRLRLRRGEGTASSEQGGCDSALSTQHSG